MHEFVNCFYKFILLCLLLIMLINLCVNSPQQLQVNLNLHVLIIVRMCSARKICIYYSFNRADYGSNVQFHLFLENCTRLHKCYIEVTYITKVHFLFIQCVRVLWKYQLKSNILSTTQCPLYNVLEVQHYVQERRFMNVHSYLPYADHKRFSPLQ